MSKMNPAQNPLLYLLADLFHTNIYEFQGEFRGTAQHDFHLAGFCSLSSQVTICVDENTEKLLTAFAHIRKELWAYVVLTKTGKWMLFFNNSTTKVRPGAEREFGHGNGMQTVTKLKKAITEARMFQDGAWRVVDLNSLLEV